MFREECVAHSPLKDLTAAIPVITGLFVETEVCLSPGEPGRQAGTTMGGRGRRAAPQHGRRARSNLLYKLCLLDYSS